MTEKINIKAELGRLVAGSYYDYQQIRTQTMNRIRDIVYRRMEDLDLTEVQERKPEEAKYLEKYKDEFIPQYVRILDDEEKLGAGEKDFIEKTLEVQKRAKKQENDYKKLMKEFVETEIVYTEFLDKIRGISQVISANLLKEFGYCEKASYISSLWAYCGYHTVCPNCVEIKEDEDGKKLKYHQVCNDNGKCPQCGSSGIAEKRKSGIRNNFSMRLRSMAWNIGESFVKQRTPFYRQIFEQEKEKQLNKEFKKGELKEKYGKPYEEDETHLRQGHANDRGKRKMVKIFLAHYWQACKELSHVAGENQEKPAKPYVQEKLNHQHISNWKEAVEAQEKKQPDDVVKK